MSSDWPQLRLDEVTTLISDCPHSTPKWMEDGVVVLRNQYIRHGRLDLSNPSFTTEDGYKGRIKRATPTAGDLVLTREAPMGEVCQIPAGLKCCLGQRMVLIRANKQTIDSKYLLYVLQSPYLKHQIGWSEGTGTTVSNIRLPYLRSFKIPVPSLQEQKSIAHILGTLDDKIELNRQMNATLESMAQALFKSWFVDFDPVIDNALEAGNPIPEPLQARAERRKTLGDQRKPLPEHIQSQFPDCFVFTQELGWVPEGWAQALFGDIATHVKNNVPAGSVGDYDCYVGLEHIGRKEIFLASHGTGDSVNSNKSGFSQNDILFGKLRPYFHKVCIAPREGICSTDILVLRPKHESAHSFAVLTASSESFVDYSNMRSTGTRMPRASAADLMQYSIILPPVEALEAFETLVAPIWKKGMTAAESNSALENLRDALLPKLLSGQLKIRDDETLLATTT